MRNGRLERAEDLLPIGGIRKVTEKSLEALFVPILCGQTWGDLSDGSHSSAVL